MDQNTSAPRSPSPGEALGQAGAGASEIWYSSSITASATTIWPRYCPICGKFEYLGTPCSATASGRLQYVTQDPAKWRVVN